MKTYSVSEVCEMIHCDSERWLVTRVRNGTFPARKINRKIVFTEDDVKAILDACAYTSDIDEFIPQLTDRSKRGAA